MDSFTLNDRGYGLEVKERASGFSFWLQGDSAEQFRAEWKTWQNKRDNNFRKFLNHHEWTLS